MPGRPAVSIEGVLILNFFAVQSLNSHTKNMEMQMKWQKKKSSGDFTADGSKTIADSVRRQAEEIRQAQQDGSAKMSSQIRLKLNSGQKLTAEEMEYLQKTDPQTYQHVKNLEAEQKNYEQELKRCKTKEEVQRVRMTHTATALSTVNDIKNNPNIPEGKKLELIWRVHQKNMALQESTQEFVESGKYAQLPTEAEKQKAEMELEEAKKDEMGITDPKDTEVTEEKESEDISAEDADKKTAEECPTQEAVESEKARAALEKRELTRMEAETSPEARKVKRAKARAAYTAAARTETVQIRQLDVKAE